MKIHFGVRVYVNEVSNDTKYREPEVQHTPHRTDRASMNNRLRESDALHSAPSHM
jgi:hypothetical protein